MAWKAGTPMSAVADSIDRCRRLQAAMSAAGVDAVLLSRWTHGFAVSGARRVQVGGSGGGVPWVVVTCGAPAPHVFTPDPDGVPDWIPAQHRHPLCWNPEALVGAVAEICAASGPGAGRPLRLAYDVLSVGMLERLARQLPVARFEDVQPLLADVRRGKSDAERVALRDAHDKAARAAAAAGAALRPGCGAADVHAAAYAQMALDGIGFPLAEVELWALGSATPTTAPRPAEPFTIGARLAVDVVVSDGGVCGRAHRTFVCGRSPTAEEEELGRAWRASVGAIARALRPGCTAERLREVVWGVAPAGGDAAVVELLVHGLGIGIEPPFLRLARPGGRQAEAETSGGTGAPGPDEGSALFVVPKVAIGAAGEMSASETLVITRDGGHPLGSSWRPWSAS